MSLTETLTWIRGKHTLKFGFEFRRNQLNSLSEANGRGIYSFSGLVTSGFDQAGNPAPATGFDMADFLLGFPQSSTIRWGSPDMYFRASNYNAYVLDDWRVTAGRFGWLFRYPPTRDRMRHSVWVSRSRPEKAACPSFMWLTFAFRPTASKAFIPPMPSSTSWASRTREPPA